MDAETITTRLHENAAREFKKQVDGLFEPIFALSYQHSVKDLELSVVVNGKYERVKVEYYTVARAVKDHLFIEMLPVMQTRAVAEFIAKVQDMDRMLEEETEQ